MHYRDLQHPDITKAEKYGMPEDTPVLCPRCGEECDTFYKTDGEILGCNVCIDAVEAYDAYEEENVFEGIFD